MRSTGDFMSEPGPFWDALKEENHAAAIGKLTAEIERLRALMPQWRPIETAPMDYEVVLIYQPAKPGFPEAWGQGHRTDLREHVHDKWVFQVPYIIAEPTHWMPMPAPPVPL